MPGDPEGTVRRQEFGKELGLVHEVIVTGRKVGADRAFWSALAHDEELFGSVVGFVNARPAFTIVVDYALSLEDMLRVGDYYRVPPNITQANFPVIGEGVHEVTVELFYFYRPMRPDKATVEMGKWGYRPAKIEELLALGAKYPELQQEFPIVAPGSVWDSRMLSLWSDLGRRDLRISKIGRRPWDEKCRFLAVRK